MCAEVCVKGEIKGESLPRYIVRCSRGQVHCEFKVLSVVVSVYKEKNSCKKVL